MQSNLSFCQKYLVNLQSPAGSHTCICLTGQTGELVCVRGWAGSGEVWNLTFKTANLRCSVVICAKIGSSCCDWAELWTAGGCTQFMQKNPVFLKLIYENIFKIMVFHLRLKFLERMVINIQQSCPFQILCKCTLLWHSGCFGEHVGLLALFYNDWNNKAMSTIDTSFKGSKTCTMFSWLSHGTCFTKNIWALVEVLCLPCAPCLQGLSYKQCAGGRATEPPPDGAALKLRVELLVYR